MIKSPLDFALNCGGKCCLICLLLKFIDHYNYLKNGVLPWLNILSNFSITFLRLKLVLKNTLIKISLLNYGFVCLHVNGVCFQSHLYLEYSKGRLKSLANRVFS